MEYYSRKNKDKFEKLEEHLSLASILCGEYMSEFGLPVTGKFLGRFHDIGKHTKKFQDVLIGKKTKVNHAIVAGQYLELIRFNCPELCKILASHHFGMYNDWDFTFDESTLNLKSDIEHKESALSSMDELIELHYWLKKSGLGTTPEEANKIKEELKYFNGKTENEKMFINRMFLSCLVDADYSSAASFENSASSSRYDSSLLDTDELITKLDNYINTLSLNSTSNKQLNDLRDEIFKSCSASGREPYKNFTLTAPTGTGKTLATLKFALENAKKYNKKRIIFVLPYLSILEQNVQVYKDICGDIVLEDDSQTVFSEKSKIYAERWSAPIIVTTSVKFFETLFAQKTSDLRRLHNISNSVIVFDESQTIPNNLLDTTLEIINVLNEKFGVTTVFSTATPPSFNYRKNIYWDAKEISSDPQSLFDKYKTIKDIKINWLLNKVTTNDELLELVKDKNSCLIIFNLKKQANNFYNLLSKNIDDQTSLFYISTNLCASHRKKILKQIKDRMNHKLPTLIVSTQCLEAGVDISADYAFRAFGPATSIAQAAGRCNRNATGKGELTVFIPEGNRKYPDNDYANLSNELNCLMHESKSFDICNLKDIDEYYKRVFNTTGLDKDKESLRTAIEKEDYIAVDKNYKIIEESGATIIVPYQGQIELFNEIKKNIIDNDYCISKNTMKNSSTITVNSYDKQILNWCNPLYFKIKGEKIKCNWYLLDSNINFYDEKLGLNFLEDFDLIL